MTERHERHKYLLIDSRVLPDVFLKVVQAKEMLAKGKAKSATMAARACGISRSAFYKYKDNVEVFDLETRGSMVSFVARGAEEEIAAVVNGRSTIFFEALPLSLEEVFISEMEAAGYDLDRIRS